MLGENSALNRWTTILYSASGHSRFPSGHHKKRRKSWWIGDTQTCRNIPSTGMSPMKAVLSWWNLVSTLIIELVKFGPCSKWSFNELPPYFALQSKTTQILTALRYGYPCTVPSLTLSRKRLSWLDRPHWPGIPLSLCSEKFSSNSLRRWDGEKDSRTCSISWMLILLHATSTCPAECLIHTGPLMVHPCFSYTANGPSPDKGMTFCSSRTWGQLLPMSNPIGTCDI